MFYDGSPAGVIPPLEVSGEAWARFARVIYAAHGGQHPASAEDPAP